MHKFLASTDIIDWATPAVLHAAKNLTAATQVDTAKACFLFVRDHIKHSWDYQDDTVTLSASEVLQAKTGYCYAKSHLLAALLRANDIPAGLCYQRLSLEGHGPPYCLHGLNAVKLADTGWYRIDARGNNPTVDAQFTPPHEQLAFSLDAYGEIDLPSVYAAPLPEVIKALNTFDSVALLYKNLPDIEPKTSVMRYTTT